jgi:dienelactone hydrolase
MSEIDGYTSFEFTAAGRTKTVYRRGSGPGVLLLHELPGMSAECIDLGGRLAEKGFTVFLPLLFGKPGQKSSLRSLLSPCVRREFNLWQAGRASPILDWLRPLSRHLRDESRHPRVGAIGMCLTGGFALTLLLDDWLMAPILSQPSLPFALPWRPGNKAALDICPRDLERVKERVATGDVRLLALRFDGDRVSPPERMFRLKEEFKERLEVVPAPGDHHSVLTLHYKEIPEPRRTQIWDQLVTFLKTQL